MATSSAEAVALLAQVTAAGLKVRELKEAKDDIKDALATMLELKKKYKELTGEDVPGGKPAKGKKKKAKKTEVKPDNTAAKPQGEGNKHDVKHGHHHEKRAGTHDHNAKPQAGANVKKDAKKEGKKEDKTPTPTSTPLTTVAPVKSGSTNSGMYSAPNAYGENYHVQTSDVMYPVNSFYADTANPPLPKMCASSIVSGRNTTASPNEDEAMQKLGDLIANLQKNIKHAESLITAHGGTVPEAEVEETGVFIGKHGEQVPLKWKQNPSAKLELTVTAHPDTVTPAMLVIGELLKTGGATVDVREYWHCCNGKAPRFPSAAKQLQLRLQPRIQCRLRVNFIWKQVERATLVVSSSQHTPIEGEANIVKFICRELSPALYPSDMFQALKVDSWIDLGDKMFGKSKDQKLALKQPNSTLGQEANTYLGGAELTLADVYLWSCIIKSEAAATGNVKAWKARLDSHPAFVAGLKAFEALA